ncbi:MAG: transglycosylase SLT domain-containing protein [Alphaproteobacteria bacterium]
MRNALSPQILAIIILILLAAAGLPPSASAAERDFLVVEGGKCAAALAAAEDAMDIPRHLLVALAVAESGRYEKKSHGIQAWPWTVTSGAQSWYLDSREAAIEKVRHLQGQGVRNIDVGCVQINLHYHKNAFDNLETAFDPGANVRYGATFLKRLHGETRSWVRAVSHYHSRTREFYIPYRRKVFRYWNLVRRTANFEHRLAMQEKFARARAARDAAGDETGH